MALCGEAPDAGNNGRCCDVTFLVVILTHKQIGIFDFRSIESEDYTIYCWDEEPDGDDFTAKLTVIINDHFKL